MTPVPPPAGAWLRTCRLCPCFLPTLAFTAAAPLVGTMLFCLAGGADAATRTGAVSRDLLFFMSIFPVVAYIAYSTGALAAAVTGAAVSVVLPYSVHPAALAAGAAVLGSVTEYASLNYVFRAARHPVAPEAVWAASGAAFLSAAVCALTIRAAFAPDGGGEPTRGH